MIALAGFKKITSDFHLVGVWKNLNNLKLRLLHVRLVPVGDSICLCIGECNKLPGSDPNSIQLFKLFFVAKEGSGYYFPDEEAERLGHVEIVRNSRNRLHDWVHSPVRESCAD